MLITPRLRLRELEALDFAALRAIDDDPEVQRYRGGRVIAPEQTRDYLERVMAERTRAPRLRHHFGLTLAGADEVIGGCWLVITSPEWREAELGYQLNRRHWGRGYATEAARALLGFGFEQLDLHRIYAKCHPENLASQRVLEKAGMRHEGQLWECAAAADDWCALNLYALHHHEWKIDLRPNISNLKSY
jgi:[ribosomal protein S5]-alanine N-acetyltransferase